MHHKLQVLLMGETFDLLHANQNFLVNLWLHAVNIISSFVLVYNALHSQMSDSTH